MSRFRLFLRQPRQDKILGHVPEEYENRINIVDGTEALALAFFRSGNDPDVEYFIAHSDRRHINNRTI